MSVLADERTRSDGLVALAVVGFIFSAVVIAIGALLLLEVVARHSFKTTDEYENVRALIVRSGAGNVSLSSTDAGGPVVVQAARTESLFTPKLQARLASDGTLTLSASCSGNLECGVHYVLSVPRDTAVTVSSGFGDVTSDDLASTSMVRIDTTAGDIHVSRLSAPVIRLSTGLGGLSATLGQPARSLTASTVAGGIELTVPDTTYALHASSGVGKVSDRAVRIDPHSPRSIDATSSLGDVTIIPGP